MEQVLGEFSDSLGQIQDKLMGWIDTLVLNIPNVVLAILVMVLTFFLSRLVKRYLRKAACKITSNTTVSNLLTNLGTFLFLLLGLFFVLGILDLHKPLNSLLAGAGVVGLAVGLALQEPLVNIFSGVLLSFRDLYNVGDLIETNGFFGHIRQITLRSTIVKKLSGEEVTIPNKLVLQNPLVNYTASPDRRLDIECGVSYGDDLDKAREVALKAVQGIDRDPARDVQLFYTSFGSSSINFVLRCWLSSSDQLNYLQVQSQAIMALKRAFDEADITIPFPIRTLDFGIKGGEKLAEQQLAVRQSNEANGQTTT